MEDFGFDAEQRVRLRCLHALVIREGLVEQAE